MNTTSEDITVIPVEQAASASIKQPTCSAKYVQMEENVSMELESESAKNAKESHRKPTCAFTVRRGTFASSIMARGFARIAKLISERTAKVIVSDALWNEILRTLPGR